jgi:hypothetical protein
MPLRDHFRPPLSNRRSWDMLHGGWPMTIVQRLFPLLPEGYFAGPGVYLTHPYEVDVAAFDADESSDGGSNAAGDGGVAVATRTTQAPTLTVESEWPDQDEYEVRIHDERRAGRLVATVEIVSPANKDRPESRRAFVAKCGALLQQDVCVLIVDVVTAKQFNLYAELFELIGVEDPALGAGPPAVYAVALRGRKRPRKRPLLDAWFHPLAIGQPLPALPLWLAPDLAVTLDLEGSYEDACRVLRIA